MIAVRQLPLPLECRRLIKQFAFEPHPVALLLKPLMWDEEDSTMGLTRRNICTNYDLDDMNAPYFLRRDPYSSQPDRIERCNVFHLHTYWWPVPSRTF